MRYAIVDQLQQVCSIADIPVEIVLRGAGLPDDFVDQPDTSVDAVKYFELWDAFAKALASPDAVLKLGLAYAHGPFVSPLFAFSCSETVERGLQNLARFKPLCGPVTMQVERAEDALLVTFQATDSNIALPSSLSLFEIVYIIECARIYTSKHIVPLVASCPGSELATDAMAEHLGIAVSESIHTQLVFSLQDAQQRLVTRNDALWQTLEPDFKQRLAAQQSSGTTRDRVKTILIETLAGGVVTSAQVANKLYTSKRSLQRKLSDEGVTFKQILTETRLELSQHYLAQPDLSLGEISYLLGFQDQTSFFRAYQIWTGETPGETRKIIKT